MPELNVFTKDGIKIVLLGPEKTGGEGTIYSVKKEPWLCAKIYFKDKITQELHKKVEAMIKNPPGENLTGHKKSLRSSSISWPVSALYDSDKRGAKFLGFTMPLIDTNLFREAHRYYDPQDRQKDLGGSFSWLYLLTTAFNLSYVVSAIHKKGHRIGDMSASNILVARTAAISIIDCDSFQIEDEKNKKVYFTKVATGDFLPPELMGKNFRNEDIDRYHSDLFALGILIFKLLMNGFHPYQARGKGVSDIPTIEQKIVRGYFPYAGTFSDVIPPKNSPPYAIISPEIRKLFYRCFVEGNKNKNMRPSAQEWTDALRTELSKIKQCRTNENHWYLCHLNNCPWCAIKNSRKDEKDIFPPNLGNKNNKTEIRTIKSAYRPAKIFTPGLNVSPKKIDLRSANMEVIKFELDIKNSGDGILTGSISSDRNWILIKNPDFTTARENKVEIVIDKNNLPQRSAGIKFAGNITISTNGGKIKVPVTFATGKEPLLGISDRKLIAKNIRKGKLLKREIQIINNGGGLLTGSIKTSRDWIKVIPADISTSSRQTVEVIIDTGKTGDNIFSFGKIDLSSNGGIYSIPVALTFTK